MTIVDGRLSHMFERGNATAPPGTVFALLRRFSPEFAVAMTICAIYRVWLSPSIIAAGDFPVSTASSLLDNLPFPSIWDASLSTGHYSILGATYFPVGVIQGLLAYMHIGWSISERLLFIFPAVVLPSFAVYGLSLSFGASRLGACLSVLAITCNSYIYLLYQGGQFGVALASGCIPLVLWTYICGQSRRRMVSYVATGLCLALQATYDIRSTYITLGMLLLFGVFNFVEWAVASTAISLREIPRVLGVYHLAIAMIVMASLHLWWILPVLLVHGATLPHGYTEITTIQALSYMRLGNALALFHPFWFSNNSRLYPINPLFFAIPLLVFGVLIRFRSELRVLYLAAVALLAAFLIKGSNDPAGNIYDWMFIHVPGFSYYRDASKFYQPLTVAYSVMLGIQASRSGTILDRQWGRRSAIFAFYIIGLVVAVLPAYPAFLQQAQGALAAGTIPPEYTRLNTFIDHQQGFFRVLWVPARPRFGTFSSLHPSLDVGQIAACCNSTSSPTKQPWLWLSRSSSLHILQALGIRYIVIPTMINSADIIGTSWSIGDVAAASSAIRAMRAALPILHELIFGHLHIFSLPNPFPLLFTVATSMTPHVATHCASNVPCFNELARYDQAALTLRSHLSIVDSYSGSRSWFNVHVHVLHAPAYLVLAQTYDPDWLMFTEPISSPISGWITLGQTPTSSRNHAVAFGYANAWLLSRPGSYHFVLEYWPQRLVVFGSAVSLLLLLFYGSLLLRGVFWHRGESTPLSWPTER